MLKRSERKSDIALRKRFGRNTLRLLISVMTLSLFSVDLSVVQAADPAVNQSVRAPYLTAGSGSFNMDGSRPPGGFQGSILKNIYGHCMSININGRVLRQGQAIVAGDCTKESFVWKSSWTPDAFYLEVKNSPGLCAIAASGLNGYDLKVLPCEWGYGLWTKLTEMSGAIKLWNTPFCLDVEGGRRTAGVPLQIWECKLVNNIPIEAQTWSMIEGGSANPPAGTVAPPVGTVAPPSGAVPPEQPYLFITQSGQQLSASWLASSGAKTYEIELSRVKKMGSFSPRNAEFWDTKNFRTSLTSLTFNIDDYPYQSHTTQRVGLRACNTVCSTWHYVDFDQFRPTGKEQKRAFDIVTNANLGIWSKIKAYKPLYFPYSSFENDVCSKSPDRPRLQGFLIADFTLACTHHDWMYRNAKRLEYDFKNLDTWNEESRKKYDQTFKFIMEEICNNNFKKGFFSSLKYGVCLTTAAAYYKAVRQLGGKCTFTWQAWPLGKKCVSIG